MVLDADFNEIFCAFTEKCSNLGNYVIIINLMAVNLMAVNLMAVKLV